MSNRLAGKVAIITGAARGQGEAEARRFVAEGAKVVITDVLDTEGEKVAADLGDDAIFVHLDVSNEDDWARVVAAAVDTFGPPTVLVNNAGIARYNNLDEMPKEEVIAHFSINVLGPWLGTKAVFEPMRRAGGGSIVNIGSTNGLRGAAGGSAYNSSKFALHGLTQSTAVELGPFGIRVNLVAPGGVVTQMAMDAVPWFGAGALDSSPANWSLPLRRMGEPDDIANVVLFLASDEAGYCTGGQFVVDGGMSADHPFKPAEQWVEHREALLADLNSN